ncbi:MAG TPA: hypothetical protein ENN14_00880 [Chloroflexi bacterium]|nr:hypothetical protein [Chloroflexota bacterium]
MNAPKILGLLFLVTLLLLPAAVLAQEGGGYDLTWSTVDGGGGLSSGNAYTLHSSIGQPDAGNLYGDLYTLAGGFWNGATPPRYQLFLPLVLRQ